VSFTSAMFSIWYFLLRSLISFYKFFLWNTLFYCIKYSYYNPIDKYMKNNRYGFS
jgi:hypothetical protein